MRDCTGIMEKENGNYCLGFRVWGLAFRDEAMGPFGVSGRGSRIWGLEFGL